MQFDFEPLRKIFDALPEESVDRMTEAIAAHRRVFVYGAGRSGLMLKALAMRLAQTGQTVYAVGEVVTPAIEKGDLLILASASGTTASVCRNAQTAKAVGATVYTVTASRRSPLAELSDFYILLSAPTKDRTESSSVMGTLFEQALLMLGDQIILGLKANIAKMRARHANLE